MGFLVNEEIGQQISEGMQIAESRIVIITPWLNMKGHFKTHLLNAIKKADKEIHIITRPIGADKAHDKNLEELWKLKEELGTRTVKKGFFRKTQEEEILHFSFVPHVHAKVVWIDNKYLIVGSANFIETSMSRNLEAANFSVVQDKDELEFINQFIGNISDDYSDSLDEKVFEHKCKSCSRVIKNPSHSHCYSCFKKKQTAEKKTEQNNNNTVCPKCGKKKQPQFSLCYTCNKAL